MKEVLQHVKEVLEYSFDHPESNELDVCIRELEQAKESAGDKTVMIEDVIRAVTHARNAQTELRITGDIPATNAFGGAFRALDQAIESYTDVNNDPF
ncbi:hypothetical protein [Bacillus sp. T33-2]|uniref:hypothetical protein n=1 Tax=Bacillus sp. T33-2 TaxID=2054168 RepID=UPI000C78B804|nr:hypothetical protein [Bacillus sp. T33-2]PLR95216.1 hypothetical protein CVD19_14650 [Bacillus sp. T33-2]